MSAAARPRSRALFAEARRLFPGGVNSPVRAFASVGGNPARWGRRVMTAAMTVPDRSLKTS